MPTRSVKERLLGLVVAVGTGATFASWPLIFARMPWQWWLVNTGAFLVG